MTPSVGPEADWELTEGAVFYAREANAEVVLRLFWNTKEHWRFYASTHILAYLGEMVDAASRCGNSPTVSSTTSVAKKLRVIALAHHRRRPSYWSGRE